MRLADRLVSNGWYEPDGSVVPWPAEDFPAVRVEADEVWGLVRSRSNWDAAELGPVVPPFDELWIEGRVPGGICTGVRIKVGSGSPLVLAVEVWTAEPRGPGFIMGGGALRISDDGVPMSWQTIRSERPNLIGYVTPALMSIGLMNCRNVGLENVVTPYKVRAKREAKTGRPPLRFTRIKLPASARQATTMNGVKAAAGETQPLHLVRGHFKTYNGDAPLFGKFTGTWWWAWQARGDQTQGVHVPTYEIASR